MGDNNNPEPQCKICLSTDVTCMGCRTLGETFGPFAVNVVDYKREKTNMPFCCQVCQNTWIHIFAEKQCDLCKTFVTGRSLPYEPMYPGVILCSPTCEKNYKEAKC